LSAKSPACDHGRTARSIMPGIPVVARGVGSRPDRWTLHQHVWGQRPRARCNGRSVPSEPRNEERSKRRPKVREEDSLLADARFASADQALSDEVAGASTPASGHRKVPIPCQRVPTQPACVPRGIPASRINSAAPRSRSGHAAAIRCDRRQRAVFLAGSSRGRRMVVNPM
jgi:hypothetical protein